MLYNTSGGDVAVAFFSLMSLEFAYEMGYEYEGPTPIDNDANGSKLRERLKWLPIIAR